MEIFFTSRRPIIYTISVYVKHVEVCKVQYTQGIEKYFFSSLGRGEWGVVKGLLNRVVLLTGHSMWAEDTKWPWTLKSALTWSWIGRQINGYVIRKEVKIKQECLKGTKINPTTHTDIFLGHIKCYFLEKLKGSIKGVSAPATSYMKREYSLFSKIFKAAALLCRVSKMCWVEVGG